MSYTNTVIMLLYTIPFTIYSQQRYPVTPFFCVMVFPEEGYHQQPKHFGVIYVTQRNFQLINTILYIYCTEHVEYQVRKNLYSNFLDNIKFLLQ